MNLAQIRELAATAFKLGPTGDAYADQRHAWVANPANRGKDMWWGKMQPYYLFLYLVAKNHAGGVSMEVGTHHGIGFTHLAAGSKASGNPKSYTIGIDTIPYDGAQEVPTKYTRCAFLHGNSISSSIVKEVETICEVEGIKINTIFIDATHTLRWVNAELNAYRHLFSDNLVVIMDDCFRADNNTMLPECFSALPGEKITFPELHTENCVGVSVTSKKDFYEKWKPTEMETAK